MRAPNQNEYIRTHALLGTGSNRTFCSMTLADQLGLKGNRTTLSLETLSAGRTSEVVQLALEVTGTMGKRRKRTVVQFPKVFAVDRFPDLKNSVVAPSDMKGWNHINDINVSRLGDSRVNLPIGQDVPKALVLLEVRYGGDTEPYATRTVLGWTLNGPVGGIDEDKTAVSNCTQVTENLEIQVKQFWDIHDVPDCGVVMSVNDRKVQRLWDDSTTLCNG